MSRLALPIRWPKYWSFSFSVSPSSGYSGLISFRIDWFDLLAVQESSPAPQLESISSSMLSLLYGSTLMIIQHYRKTIALTIWALSVKFFSYALLFYMLFRFVIAFCPRRKHHLNSWLQSPTTVIWSPRK